MNEQSITGRISIELDEQELEATLVFHPDDSGEQWTAQRITALVREQNIREGFDPAQVEELVASWAKGAKTETAEQRAVIARGQPPVASQPGEIQWAELPVPDELKEEVEQVLSRGSPPAVYNRRVEKRKVEKVEQRTGVRALLKREEKRTTVEKVETKEPVSVDPTVTGSGWAPEGSTVATLFLPVPGKMGKNVFGRPIPADRPEQLTVYLSDHLTRTAREIRCETAGVFRHGENWAELIPFRPCTLDVHPSADKATCLLTLRPGSPGARAPSVDEVLAAAEACGFSRDELLPPAQIKRLVDTSLNSGDALTDVPISSAADALVQLSVSEDGLLATLTLRKGSGSGRPLSLKEIGETIRAAKLKGMDAARVKQDILKFYHGPERELKEYVLAEGKAPSRGADGSIEWKVSFLPDSQTARFTQAAGKRLQALSEFTSLDEFPLAQVQRVAIVRATEEIAVITPPAVGARGLSVRGEELPGLPGRAVSVRCFENTELLGTRVVAVLTGLLEMGERDQELLLRVRPHRDAEARVKVSPDLMTATLTLIPHEGTGEPLTPQRIDEALREAGVVRGIKRETVEAAYQAFQRGESVADLPVAMGQPPREPEESRITFHVHLATGRSVTIDSAGRAHYRNQDRITLVQKDQLLAEMVLPRKEETSGWDVAGNEVAGGSAAVERLEAGKNVRTEEADGKTRFLAECAGELVKEGNLLHVRDLYTVRGDVGLSTGNIRFNGSVAVAGNVTAGFSVFSGRDISVKGTVEAALLSADESIIVEGGIKGQGKAVLRAKGEIRASFAEQAALLAVGDVHIKNAALRCTIKCNGSLNLGAERGNLVGGTARCRRGVSAANIGSERSAPTHISFGQDYLIGDQIEQEERRIAKLREENRVLDTEMRRQERSPAGDSAALKRARAKKLQNLKVIERRTQRLFILKEKFEEHIASEVRVTGTIYPGVVLESHGRTHEIREPATNVVFAFNTETGRIEQQVGSEHPAVNAAADSESRTPDSAAPPSRNDRT